MSSGGAHHADAIEVVVNREGFDVVSEEEIVPAVRLTLSDAGVDQAEISVTFLGDEEIREMNREYLGRDRPTDVIAFSLGEEGAPLGDVYVGVDEARRNAESHDVSLEEELVRLAIHGTLHVLGHDHPEGARRVESPMFALQERLVREARGGR